MVHRTKEAVSLSQFKRESKKFVEKLRQTGQPIVLTMNGKAELVVQDAASYERLLELAERAESLELLRERLRDTDAGRVQPMREVVKALSSRRSMGEE